MTTGKMPKDSGVVTISKAEYDRLKKRDAWLGYLEEAGIDNWEGCEIATDLYKEDHPDE